LQTKHGEIKTALQMTQQALDCFPSENSEWHWRFTILKAELLWRQGSASQSLALLAAEPPDSLAATDLAIRRKLALITAYAFTQRLSEADRLLTEVEDLARKSHPELLGEIAIRRGTVRYLAGNIKQAEADFQKSLQIARELKDPFLEAAALESLGVVATQREHYDEAIEWDRTASQVARSVGAQRLLAEIDGNMGWCFRKLGDFENALSLYNQAEETSTRLGLVGDQIYWLTGIANVHYEQHQYASAQTVLDQALNMARRQDDKGILIEFLNDLSEIAIETGQVDLADKYQNEASTVEKVNPDQSATIESALIRGRILQSRGQYAAAEDCFRQLIADLKTSSSQRWEGRARLASVYAEEKFDSKAEKEFRGSFDTIEQARASVQSEELRMSFISTALSFYDDYIKFLVAHRRVRDALQLAELSRARTLAERLGTQPKTLSFGARDFQPQQIAHRLNSTLLFYWTGWKQSHLWVITPANTLYFPIPPLSEIEPVVKAYRRSILDGHDVLNSENENGKELYRMLVAPARNVIPKNSRVILLPAESLYGLNFETLIVPDATPHFWIEDVTMSEAISLTLLAHSNQAVVPKERTLLLVGNSEAPNSDFPVLTQAPAEMQKVAAHFPQTKREVLSGRDATPSAYLASNPGNFSYLHFVTHSTANHTRPLDSAVILTKENGSYKLYARDIVAHPLQAQLVTISACNSAGTRAYAGEGLVGLSWAFLGAGARNVIGSLWEVSDAPSTGQLMDTLYDGLDDGKDPMTALHDAKISLIKSNSDNVFRRPFYWAPFQLYRGSY
jgi:CHAT domain-containing protein/tetratricopeptide (TPR) repeat protein